MFGHLNHTLSIAVMRVYGLGKISYQQCGPPEAFYLGALGNVNISDALLQTAETIALYLCKSSPITGLDRPRGFQEVKVPRFHDNGTGWW